MSNLFWLRILYAKRDWRGGRGGRGMSNNKKKIKIQHTSPADENKLALRYAERILQGSPSPKRKGKK